MSLLQRNYPHVKIELPTAPLIFGNSLSVFGFVLPADGVATINARVLSAANPPIAGTSYPGSFPYDWLAIFQHLPVYQDLVLEIEAVDTYGNTGKDAHCFICLPLTEEWLPRKHDDQPHGHGGPLIQAVIHILSPTTNPCSVSTPGTLTVFGSISDSSLIPSMTAKIVDSNGNVYNGVPSGGSGMGSGFPGTWTFAFVFSNSLSGATGTLTVSAPGATSDTRNLTFS